MTLIARLYIDGQWRDASDRGRMGVLDPADESVIGEIPVATLDDMDEALASAQRAFAAWRQVSAWDRAALLKRTAELIMQRRPALARDLTREQGKTIAESLGEIDRCVDVFNWCAEEAVRSYGRLLPPRRAGARQATLKEPIGPVAAFTPWNFPAVLSARKIAAALGAGCSIILKPSEETPAAVAGLVQCLEDAGAPAGVVNVLMGNPPDISERLIESPVTRKVTLTGSIPVGRLLSSLAGQHLKPATMELGGHSPVIVFQDADVEKAAQMTAAFKFRNAGQVCLGVSRVFVHQDVYDRFLEAFLAQVRLIRTGNGFDEGVTMGPMANQRRCAAMDHLIRDATADHGARIALGSGVRDGDGFFVEPTVLTDVSDDAAIMTDEPFGPVVPIASFRSFDEVIARANSLDYGLAGYAFTGSLRTATLTADALDVGWIGINDFSPALSEAPLGCAKDSGFGYEGGPEGFDAYCKIKFVSQMCD
ncbi:MAG: NAD-dependent succinate-semialdehyde dehydrogenase [Pseudomonadota bacterium]